jgi:ribosomal protein S27AE
VFDPNEQKTVRDVAECNNCGGPLSARRFDHPPDGDRLNEFPRCGHDSFADLRG